MLMDCIIKKCEESYKKRKNNEKQHFKDIQKGLNDSMIKFKEIFNEINNWDELLNLKDESLKKEKFNSQTIKNNCKNKYSLFEKFGLIFCLFHLIGIQESIIIINSLFGELVEELQLMINGTPREYDFYQKLEINSYKYLPEIDVAMMTSSVGIFFLRHFGFYCSDITFQMISSILFFLLFILFDFKNNDKIRDSYNRVESLVLILTYIILSITVGCLSTIALKEYFDIISILKEENIENEKNSEKLDFYFLSVVSLLIIMGINRKIITSISNKKHTLILLYIIIIIFSSFILSLVFHFIFLMPVKYKEKNKLKEKVLNNSKKIVNIINSNQKKDSDIKIPNIDSEMAINITKENIDNNLNLETGNTESNKESEDIIIKFSQSFPQIKNLTNELIIKELHLSKKNKKKEIKNSTKICTLCGYIYFQKRIGNKSTCICYYYTSKCTWLKEKIIKFDVIFPIIIELYCQLCIIGFNYLLTEKLIKVYSFKKNIKFYLALLILSFFLCNYCFS